MSDVRRAIGISMSVQLVGDDAAAIFFRHRRRLSSRTHATRTDTEMKHGAPFVVKQYAPMIGAPAGTRTRRLRVVYFAYTVAEALTVATRRGYPACWIERRDAPAWTRRRRKGPA